MDLKLNNIVFNREYVFIQQPNIFNVIEWNDHGS